jgi:hypothetical protein
MTDAIAVPAVEVFARRQAAMGPSIKPALGAPAAGPPTALDGQAVVYGLLDGAPGAAGELRGFGYCPVGSSKVTWSVAPLDKALSELEMIE